MQLEKVPTLLDGFLCLLGYPLHHMKRRQVVNLSSVRTPMLEALEQYFDVAF